MHDNFLSFIIKDLFKCNDNLISIHYNENLNITCTCGFDYCDHSDYLLKCISESINHKVEYGNKNFILVSFKDDKYLEFQVKDITNNFKHKIKLKYINDSFCVECCCKNELCRSSEYALLSFILRYGENKKKHINNKINYEIKKIHQTYI